MSRNRQSIDERAPAVVERAAPLVPRHGRLIPALDCPIEALPTNLNLADPAQRVIAFNATTWNDEGVPAGGSIDFTACWWLVHRIVRPDERTGELKELTRTVLIAPDGSCVATTSDVVPHILARALEWFTPEEWARGIEFSLVCRPRRAGPGTWHQLVCRSVPAAATPGTEEVPRA